MNVFEWRKYPYDAAEYDYKPDQLSKHWATLHAGDREPFPNSARIKALFTEAPHLASTAGCEANVAAERLQEGWRRFHRGDFAGAAEFGNSLGLTGATLAAKAQATYAHYLEPDAEAKRALLLGVARRMEDLERALPHEANGHYHRAYTLGRYSQLISIAEALKQGIAGQIRHALDATLEQEPKHADAHTALGTYQAEIIDKIGAVIGGVTYGANREDAITHYRQGIELAPRSVSAMTEYADGLLMIYGKKKVADATRLYEQAVDLEPYDALSRLDWELAKEQLS